MFYPLPRSTCRRVKFGGSEDGQDTVDVQVAVDPHCLSALPEEREKLVKDVVYAVRDDEGQRGQEGQ